MEAEVEQVPMLVKVRYLVALEEAVDLISSV
jgi:hypothetical protein